MDYEKKYKEALELARKLKDEYNDIEGYCPNQWLCEKLFPELAESEDEKIREAISNFINENNPYKKLKEETKKQWISWLEKQKATTHKAKYEKQIVLLTESNGNFEIAYSTKTLSDAQKMLKLGLAHTCELVTEESKPATIHKFRVGDTVRRKSDGLEAKVVNIVNGNMEVECDDWTQFVLDKDWELVEQKPEEWSEEDRNIINELISVFDNTIPLSLIHTHKQYADWLKSLKDRCLPQLKQEWSEEDEDNFKHLMDEIVCLGNNRNSSKRLYYDRLIKFLEELKNWAQPKEKWCDKDERMLDRLIAYFEKRVAFTDDDNTRYANWLKSLRPQNREDLTDKEKAKIWDALNKTYAVDLRDKLFEKVITCSPQKQWRPSEEQICFLAAVVNDPNNASSESCHVVLKTLLEQLKAL